MVDYFLEPFCTEEVLKLRTNYCKYQKIFYGVNVDECFTFKKGYFVSIIRQYRIYFSKILVKKREYFTQNYLKNRLKIAQIMP